MKTFTVKEYCQATVVYTYEVEAENEEQAVHMVIDGEVEPTEMETNVWEDGENEIEVLED